MSPRGPSRVYRANHVRRRLADSPRKFRDHPRPGRPSFDDTEGLSYDYFKHRYYNNRIAFVTEARAYTLFLFFFFTPV